MLERLSRFCTRKAAVLRGSASPLQATGWLRWHYVSRGCRRWAGRGGRCCRNGACPRPSYFARLVCRGGRVGLELLEDGCARRPRPVRVRRSGGSGAEPRLSSVRLDGATGSVAAGHPAGGTGERTPAGKRACVHGPHRARLALRDDGPCRLRGYGGRRDAAAHVRHCSWPRHFVVAAGATVRSRSGSPVSRRPEDERRGSAFVGDGPGGSSRARASHRMGVESRCVAAAPSASYRSPGPASPRRE